MSLEGKAIVISGGSRGIGRNVVSALAEKGARVAFTYHSNEKAAQEVLEEAEKFPGTVRAYQVDMKDQIQVKKFVADVVKEWGTLDVIINNAGIRKDKTLAFLSSEDWDGVVRTNLYGAYYLTQAGIFYLLKKKQGRVINVSSVSGINGIAGQTNYSSSKAALFGFTRALAKEVAPYGISVNCVAPGGVETDMTDGMPEKEREKLLAGVPIGRLCKPEEVTKMILFLADEELSPSYLTGTVIPLDGGLGL